MKITNKEQEVLESIVNSNYNCTDDKTDRDLIGYEVWMWDVADTSGITGKSFSGVCSSLLEKGLIDTDTQGDKTQIGIAIKNTYTITLTEKGFKAIQ